MFGILNWFKKIIIRDIRFRANTVITNYPLDHNNILKFLLKSSVSTVSNIMLKKMLLVTWWGVILVLIYEQPVFHAKILSPMLLKFTELSKMIGIPEAVKEIVIPTVGITGSKLASFGLGYIITDSTVLKGVSYTIGTVIGVSTTIAVNKRIKENDNENDNDIT